MEKYLNLKNSEHLELISHIVKDIDKKEIKKVLDAGSGKTSLSILLQLFPSSEIDAIVFYNDFRKINTIKESVESLRYTLTEKDICKDYIDKEYDLILAHLLLGEAAKWGNKFKDLLANLIKIKCKYLIIYEIKEDPSIDYKTIETTLSNKFAIIKKEEISKKFPQEYEKFTSRTYIAYLFKAKKF